MSRKRNSKNVTENKNEAVQKLDSLLTKMIHSKTDKLLKKSDLVSYWIKSFSDYIYREESFNPNKLIRYSRGDVIRVNFGFRVGKEFGGLHYAVVLDNKNNRSSHVITVIPLSSTDGKKIHPNNVDLGSELFYKVKDQSEKLIVKLEAMSNEIGRLLKLYNELLPSEVSSKDVLDLTNKHKEVLDDLSLLKKYAKEISRMKDGSMAIVNQITTVSKQRIYVPKKSTDFLYNIKLSPTAMDKINDKIKSMYIK